MTELRTRPDGAYELIQNHCPVAKAASAFPEICGVEARVLRETLGCVKVTLKEHRLRGSRRCVLHIAPQK
jgi:predicted ArsR family transcriptional regulator